MKMMTVPTCSTAIRGMMLSELVLKPFPDRKEFTILITEVVSPDLFYGQLVSNDSIEALQELTLALHKVYSSDNNDSFTPKINEICVAKFTDGQWYRASIVLYNADMTACVSSNCLFLQTFSNFSFDECSLKKNLENANFGFHFIVNK